MQSFDPSGRYGAGPVIEALQGRTGDRTVDFRYDLLTSTNQLKTQNLAGILSGSVSQDSTADVKRTATFTIRDGIDSIDYGMDRIRPWFRLRMPDGLYVEWPLGVFLLSSPSRNLDPSGSVVRTVSAYDQGVVLTGDKVGDRYSIPAGTTYTGAIYDMALSAGITSMSITPSGLTLPVTWDYEAGTAKLTIINDLLSSMGYRSAWFDEYGYLIAEPYVVPLNRSVGYTYATDSTSVILGDVEQSIDLFDIPNKWTLVVSDTDQGSFSSTFVNADPASPTSTVSRGRTILYFDSGQSAADQATLDKLVRKVAYETAQLFEAVTITTANMPFHSNADMIGATISGLGVNSAYEELSWSMDLRAGGQMSHTLQRVSSVIGGL